MNHHVFVYGTLRQGFHNNRLLTSSVLMGDAVIRGTIADLGGCPALITIGGSGTVHGEVYQVDDSVLRSLDRLEGYLGPNDKGNWYERITVGVYFKRPEIMDCVCYTYYMYPRQDRTYNIIQHGDWKKHREQT